jgi:nucleotide-binding universal stress UspA family protein
MKKPKRILVGLKSMDQTVELLDIACRLGAHRDATLFLVHILEVPDATPLDASLPDLEARAAKILAAGARIAKRGGMKVSTMILRARSAGRALVEEAKDKRVDMVVLGSHRRRTLGELFSGTTHQYVAKRAPCQVLLSVPPA